MGWWSWRQRPGSAIRNIVITIIIGGIRDLVGMIDQGLCLDVRAVLQVCIWLVLLPLLRRIRDGCWPMVIVLVLVVGVGVLFV